MLHRLLPSALSLAGIAPIAASALLVSAVFCHASRAAASPLPRSVPESRGVDSAGLLRFIEALEQRVDAVHSVMLLRNGAVVAEGFWAPHRADDLHVMYSVTKSFTSTAVGLAAQEGLLTLDDTVLSHFPEHAPARPDEKMKEMRIRDLLRMSTGHDVDPSAAVKAASDGAWVKAFLATKVADKPGTHFLYNSAGSYVLGAIVQKVSGETLEEYLRSRLFEPLGLKQPLWRKSPEGVSLGDGGISLRTEDIARFGLLYLQKGVYGGKRVLSEQWVEAATSLQTATGGNPESNWDHGYGYQFWRNKVTGYRADGAFGQFSFVLPEHGVVLALTSGTADMGGVMDVVWEQLLPALRDRPLPANPAAHERLAEKLAALELPPQAGVGTAAVAPSVSGKVYRFPANELEIRSVSVDFSGAAPRLHVEDRDGKHDIACGLGRWVRGRTSYNRRISNAYDTAEHGVAGSCGWGEDGAFGVKLSFYETPYTVTHRLRFQGDRLALETEQNVRWGDTRRPTLRGIAGKP